MAWLIALTVLGLLTAAGTAIALVQLHTSDTRLSADTGPAGPGGNGLAHLDGAAAARKQAAAWIAKEISKNSIIACDTLMCGELSKAGVSANLLMVSATTPDPLGADIVVATPALRSQFGSRLAGEYAPSVLASFGAGSVRVDVRVVAGQGAAAYEAALKSDLAARKVFGTRLLSNRQITMSASARADLTAGRVDPRLLLTLPVLAGTHPVVVLAFYDQAPGAGPGIPLSGADFSASDSQAAGLTPAAYHRWLVTTLSSQIPPFNAASVTTGVRNGIKVVSVRFARPNPFGLIHL